MGGVGATGTLAQAPQHVPNGVPAQQVLFIGVCLRSAMAASTQCSSRIMCSSSRVGRIPAAMRMLKLFSPILQGRKPALRLV